MVNQEGCERKPLDQLCWLRRIVPRLFNNVVSNVKVT
jgi:hypothetical protein